MSKRRREPGTPALDISILLDRTGSMADAWPETLTAVNSYCRSLLADPTIDARLMLTTFHRAGETASIEVARHWCKEEWVDLQADEDLLKPLGQTPLYEAVGRILTGLEAEARPRDTRVQFVVMTDGEENASHPSWSRDRVVAMVEHANKKENWSVVFLGANLSTWVGQTMGTRYGSTMTYSPQHVDTTMNFMATATRSFGATGQSVNFSDAARQSVVSQASIDAAVLAGQQALSQLGMRNFDILRGRNLTGSGIPGTTPGTAAPGTPPTPPAEKTQADGNT